MKQLLFLFATLFLFNACSKDLSPEEQLVKDLDKIQDYLTDNNLTAQSLPSGLHYIIDVPGSSEHPTLADQVTVHYKGYFLDGDVFDQTSGTPITFSLGGVIEGWQQGITLFGKGGKGVLLLPSYLAYGTNPPSGIPKNAVMIFDVELVDF